MASITTISKRWQEEGLKYAKSVNKFVNKGMTLGWEKVGKEPKETRTDLAEKVIQFVREYNEMGNIDDLREKFPPAHAPFIEMLEENGRSIGPILLLNSNKILVRVGSAYEKGEIFLIDGPNISSIKDIISFGRLPNRKYFAIAKSSGVEVYEGWEGRQAARLNWPTSLEGIPKDINIERRKGVPPITQLLPFPDGKRVLLVSSEGIFVLPTDGSIRLYPGAKEIQEYLNWLKEEHPPRKTAGMHIDMAHGAISADGKFIAIGGQDSHHLIFNDKYELIGNVGPMSEYPHYSIFSEDNDMLACNSCHFYNGITIGVPLSLLPNLETESYSLDDRLVMLEGQSRIYAAVFQNDKLILGDAYGYLRAVDKKGNLLWEHFIGSSIGDIDISPDGKMLVASTYAGFLSIIALDTGKPDPYTIGTSTHREIRRWLFWKKEKRPLAW